MSTTNPVEVFVEDEEVLGLVTLHVVPPLADERLLVEHGAVRTKQAVLAPVVVTVVIHLKSKKKHRRDKPGL